MNPLLTACIRAVQFTVLAGVVSGMAILYFVLFFMGFEFGRGDEVFLLLSSYGSFFYSCAIVSCGLTISLAVLDVGYWRGPVFKLLAYLMYAATLTAYMLTALSFTSAFPSSPLVIYIMLCPCVVYVLQLSPIYSRLESHVFALQLAIVLALVAVVSLAVWLYWLVYYNMWWYEPVQFDFYTRLGCVSDGYNSTLPGGGYNITQVVLQVEQSGECNAAIVEWISPLLLGVFCLLMSVSMFFLVRAELSKLKHKRQMDFKSQAFAVLLSLVLLGMWASAGIAGANIHLSSIVFAFCFLFFVLGATAMLLTSGREGVYKNLMSVPLAKRVLESVHSDWLRALLLLGVIPASLAVLPLSRLRQLGRRHLFFTKRIQAEERALFFDLEASRMLNKARKWHWTSVLAKMIWWGVAFFSLSVICGRVLNVIFSALGQQIEEMQLSLWPVVGVFTVVSFLLYQFPPTPGMPIFYACAVILTKSAMLEGWDFWAGWALSTVVALLLKYSSLVSGQLLGQVWGKYSVGVRKTVGINSYEMRAIRFILTKPGLNFRKSAMLCGSPDWPAAVICGILNTSYVQNIVHQLPVIIIVLPITLSGSLTLMGSANAVYSSAATICLSIAVLAQGLSMMITMHYIEDTVQYQKPELDKFPADEAVAALDEKDRLRVQHRKYVSTWRFIPCVLKLIVLSGVLAETFSLYLFLLFSSQCFVAFDVTDSIAQELGGSAWNLVKPLGWAGIAGFTYGCVVLIVLGRWISCQKQSSASTAAEVEHAAAQEEQQLAVTPMKSGGEEGGEETTTTYQDNDDGVFHPRFKTCSGVCWKGD